MARQQREGSTEEDQRDKQVTCKLFFGEKDRCKTDIHSDCTIRDCELCLREPIMPLVYEDEHVWVTYCKTCKLAMSVWKEHKTELTPSEKNIMMVAQLKAFPEVMNFQVRKPRSILDHYHEHITNIKYEEKDETDT